MADNQKFDWKDAAHIGFNLNVSAQEFRSNRYCIRRTLDLTDEIMENGLNLSYSVSTIDTNREYFDAVFSAWPDFGIRCLEVPNAYVLQRFKYTYFGSFIRRKTNSKLEQWLIDAIPKDKVTLIFSEAKSNSKGKIVNINTPFEIEKYMLEKLRKTIIKNGEDNKNEKPFDNYFIFEPDECQLKELEYRFEKRLEILNN
ncbi:MAG: hypothetical protein PHH54_03545 [Candidatus Nanoarchaeia archaeon]|nr:hypothetical protein [Candidatus Nanoarchaeia archaeon]MDD5741032.1 hypothetical protein [Candidatus Nanoarchaeia archaeon]